MSEPNIQYLKGEDDYDCFLPQEISLVNPSPIDQEIVLSTAETLSMANKKEIVLLTDEAVAIANKIQESYGEALEVWPPQSSVTTLPIHEEPLQIFVKNFNSSSKVVFVNRHDFIRDVKKKIEQKEQIPLEVQVLVSEFRLLQDTMMVGDYPHITEGSTLSLVGRLRGGKRKHRKKKKREVPFPIDDLRDDLLSVIFELKDAKTVAVCSRVCTRWARLCRNVLAVNWIKTNFSSEVLEIRVPRMGIGLDNILSKPIRPQFVVGCTGSWVDQDVEHKQTMKRVGIYIPIITAAGMALFDETEVKQDDDINTMRIITTVGNLPNCKVDAIGFFPKNYAYREDRQFDLKGFLKDVRSFSKIPSLIVLFLIYPFSVEIKKYFAEVSSKIKKKFKDVYFICLEVSNLKFRSIPSLYQRRGVEIHRVGAAFVFAKKPGLGRLAPQIRVDEVGTVNHKFDKAYFLDRGETLRVVMRREQSEQVMRLTKLHNTLRGGQVLDR